MEKEVSEYEKDKDGKDTYVPKKWKENTKVVFDDTKYKSLYIKNFWVDEAATGIENANDCMELELWNEDRFHSNYDELYPNAKIVQGNAVFDYEWYATEEAVEKVECLYYYNKARDMFSIIANGVLLTKPDNPNPYKHKELPYVQSVCIPRVKSFYGMGFPRLVRSLQEEKDTIRNMRIDSAKLAINNIVVIDDRVELDDEDLEVRPNQIIRGPVDGINFIKPPELNTATYKEEELLKEDIIRVTGVDPRLQTMGGAGDTATEIAILKESSMKRIRLIMRTIEWKALYRIGRLRLANFLQFYSIPKYKDIIGEDGEITSEPFYPTVMNQKEGKAEQVQFKDMDFKGEYDVMVSAGSTLPISDAVENQKITNLFDRLKGHPDVNQRSLAEALIRSTKSVYMPPNELMTKPNEPPMGESPARGPEGIPPMPGQGTGLQQATQVPIEAMTARQTGPQNFNQ